MEADAPQQQKAPRNKRKMLFGFLMIIVGFVFGYFFIYRKLEEMKLHENISYSTKALLIVPLCFVFGIYTILFPPAGSGAWKDLTPREKPYFIGALVLSMLLAAGLYYWFELQLTAYGYK